MKVAVMETPPQVLVMSNHSHRIETIIVQTNINIALRGQSVIREISPALDLGRWRLFRLWKTAGNFWLY